MLLSDLLKTSSKSSPCLEDGVRFTYGELDSLSSSVAADLIDRGTKRGDRVALLLPNSWQFVSVLFGITKAGGIPVMLDYRSSGREIDYYILDSKASIIFSDEKKWNAAAPSAKVQAILLNTSQDSAPSMGKNLSSQLPKLDGTDVALLLYTGGTTGKSKGVMLTHVNISSVLSGLSNAWALQNGKEVFAQILPMSHSGGLNCGLNSALFSGGKTIIIRKFEALSFIESVLKNNVTAFVAVPAIYWALVAEDSLGKLRSSSLRICFCSGAHIAPSVAELFREKTGIIINVGWGLTEASPQLTVAPLGTFKENYVGKPIDLTEVVSLDSNDNPSKEGEVGELAARGSQIMKGYWMNELGTSKVFTAEHFFKTGDIGYVTKEGVFLLGRKNEVINSGGYKIWPQEVEGVLMENEKVNEAAVVAVEDKKFGEVVKAFVVLKSSIQEEELRTFLKARLSSYKVPRYFEFVDALPKSSVGKILHRVLRETEKVS